MYRKFSSGNFEHPDPVGCVPAHGRGFGIRWSLWSFPVQIILWFYDRVFQAGGLAGGLQAGGLVDLCRSWIPKPHSTGDVTIQWHLTQPSVSNKNHLAYCCWYQFWGNKIQFIFRINSLAQFLSFRNTQAFSYGQYLASAEARHLCQLLFFQQFTDWVQ